MKKNEFIVEQSIFSIIYNKLKDMHYSYTELDVLEEGFKQLEDLISNKLTTNIKMYYSDHNTDYEPLDPDTISDMYTDPDKLLQKYHTIQ